MKLWYEKSARKWIECLALGNATIGVMADGGAKKETLYFNDATLWSGYPKEDTNPKSLTNLEEIRTLIFNRENAKAEELLKNTSLGNYSESFLPLANLHINYIIKGGLSTYKRELDLSTAIHTKSFKIAKNEITSQIFASYPQNAVFYTFSSLNPIDFSLNLTSKLNYNTEYIKNEAYIYGNAPDICMPPYVKVKNAIVYKDKGMAFCLGLKIITDGLVEFTSKKVSVKGAKGAIIVIKTATGFEGYDKHPCTDTNIIKEKLKKELSNSFDIDAAKKEHINDYKNLFDRVDLTLDYDKDDMPTDKLIKSAKKGTIDNRVIKLLYDFGRYLAISSSRGGSQPSNLQGIWNKDLRPAWSSNMTVNINTQMNYWPVGECNLFECLTPYKRLLLELSENGKNTAKINYGAKGFAVNHNVDIWRKTTPVGGNPVYAYFPMAGVWLANGMYREYRHFFDRLKKEEFEEIYQIIRNAALFVNDWLYFKDGYYHTVPSTSPEHQFYSEGKKLAVDRSASIDIALCHELIENLSEISKLLAKEDELVISLQEKKQKLYKIQDGKHGISEWGDDYMFGENGHRHFSPLYALFPSRLDNNDEDSAKFKKFLDYRIQNGSGYTGWSAAWSTILYACLNEGEMAYEMLSKLIKNSIFINLFDKHPPQIFQIDGNLGLVSGINKLIVQSKEGLIWLLPALPRRLKNGRLNGVLTENGAILDIEWLDYKVVSLSSNKKCRVKNINLALDVRLKGDIEIIDYKV